MTEPQIAKGLAGIYADTSRISKVFDDTNTLTYYGYPVQELAASCRFEEVAYLLWHGELPTAEQLKKFELEERKERRISPKLLTVLRQFDKSAHPMDTLRTAVSFMGTEDPAWADNAPAANLKKATRMLAQIPTIIAADFRLRNGQEPVAPREDLTMAENFFHMYFGTVPEKEVVRCFDASLTFYAEHSFNASTFTARVIISSLSDIYAAVTGAIGSLKGPLHGGANEAVMHMLLDIKEPSQAQAWIDEALSGKKKLVMGFGHRVYKNGDSRVPHMTKYFHDMAKLKGGQKWIDIEEILAKTMLEKKNIHPNLDYPVGPAYYLMGFDIPVFTPIFVMSRITGWAAHIIEQLSDNKLLRPLAVYNGVPQRSVQPLEKRKVA
ncbi:MAG: bifunctional 2-methylcitrate synthase/citrate synthase [Alphaproteobacteria bacterium]|nr:bifunctional 2-methylcitrate synthase/citrate synthase [Alphaproteobacteria bacterium]MDE2336806.1 bifunctional 2-methylcitrate synthase/citrate synthase [Alphaproteobacteria bacterium]